MARLKRAEAILEAAEWWKQQCLLGEGSLFSEEQLWIRENFEQLRTHFVERPDEGEGKFYKKLRQQLEPASPAAKRLWSEMTWVYYLISDSYKAETKLDRIKTVWGWSGSEFPGRAWALDVKAVLARGIANSGTAYKIHISHEFRFFITAMIKWFSLPVPSRWSLLTDPWRLAEWLDEQMDSRTRQLGLRHVLLYLLFPDSFESIISNKDKKKIAKAFYRRWKKPIPNDDSSIALDRILLKVRNRLATEFPDEEIDFYLPPFLKVWKDTTSSATENPPSTGEDAET